MRPPRSLVLRSCALATALLLASVGTTLAHAGESHADSSAGGWSAIGWYGVAAVVAMVLGLGLFTRHRPDVPAPLPDDPEPHDPRVPER